MRRASLGLLVGLFLLTLPGWAAADEGGKQVKWGAGLRVRANNVPTWLTELFVEHSTPMTSAGFGVEAVRRRGDFDIAFGLEYENVSPDNGYWLENGGMLNPADLDWVEFDSLAIIGVDATFAWHTQITPMFQLRYGAGIGVAVVLGDVFQYEGTCPGGASVSDLDDPGSPNAAGCFYTPGTRAKSNDVPPAVPIVHGFLGLRIKLTDKININVDGGFRDMFYLGLGTQFIF